MHLPLAGHFLLFQYWLDLVLFMNYLVRFWKQLDRAGVINTAAFQMKASKVTEEKQFI